MDNLLLNIIVEKDIKRQLKLIAELKRKGFEVELDSISREFGVTIRTIQNDIHSIRRYLSDPTDIVLKKGVIYFNYNNKDVISQLQYSLAQSALSMRIIQNAYNNCKDTFELLCIKMYSSKSTVRIRIAQLNEVLKKFNVRIAYNGGTIKGTEVCIRRFFHAFYSQYQAVYEKSSLNGGDISKVFEALREEMITRKLKRVNFSYHILRTWLVITNDRIVAGCPIKLNDKLMKSIETDESYQDYVDVYELVMHKYFGHSQISRDEKVWAYITCLSSVVYVKGSSDLMLTRGTNALAGHKQIIISLIELSAKYLSIDHAVLSEYIRVHLAYFENFKILSSLSSTYQLASESVKLFVTENLYSAYRAWHMILEENYFSNRVDFLVNLEDISCQLAMISSQFLHNQRTKVRRILFSLSGESGVAAYLEVIARKLFGIESECFFVYNQLLSEELIKEISPDVIVINYINFEKLSFSNIIKVPYIPKQSDWVSIFEYLTKISKYD